MRSSTPIVFGFLALVGMAFWYDAHSRDLVGGAGGEARAAAATVATVAAPAAGAPAPAAAAGTPEPVAAAHASVVDAVTQSQSSSLVAREEREEK